MKLNLYKSVALCSLLALAGCHDFEEMNTNPNVIRHLLNLNLKHLVL